MLPSLLDLYTIHHNDQGTPTGLRCDTERLRKVARETPLEHLIVALNNPENLHALLGTLSVVCAIPMSRPMEALEPLLLRWITDDRAHTWIWGERIYQKRVFDVGSMAVEARLHLLEHQARAHKLRRKTSFGAKIPDPSIPPDITGALQNCMDRALWNMGGPESTRTVLKISRRFYVLSDKPNEITSTLSGCFARAIRDRSRVASLRAMAAREAHRAAQTSPKIFRQTAQHVASALTSALSEPHIDFRLQREGYELLMEIAPNQIGALQHRGVLLTEPLPSPRELISHWGRADEKKAQHTAARVAPEVILRKLREGSLTEKLSAATLSPWLAERIPWEQLAEALLDLIPSADTWRPNTREKTTKEVDLGIFASSRLIKLLAHYLRKGEPTSIQLLHQGLSRTLARAGSPSRLLPEIARRYIDATRYIPDKESISYYVEMRAVAFNRKLDAYTRFAAILLDRTPETLQRAGQILLNHDEDPTLRVLIGEHAHQWTPEILAPHVDRSTDPWTLKEGGRRNLPIGEPSRKLPVPWLLHTIQLAGDILPMEAIRALGSRFSRQSTPESIARAQRTLLELDHPSIREQLRRALHSKHKGAPTWGAAVCVALLGSPEDEEGLFRFIAHNGPWSTLNPHTEDISATRLTDHLLLRPLQHHSPHHLIEPFLSIGYGPDQARRIMARAFADMGKRAIQKKALQEAWNACKHARELDPFNLEARRIARALEHKP